MAVDVITETIIDRPIGEVAEHAVSPDNAPEWHVNIKSVNGKKPPPRAVGSRFAFVVHFLGALLLACAGELKRLPPSLDASNAEGPEAPDASSVRALDPPPRTAPMPSSDKPSAEQGDGHRGDGAHQTHEEHAP